MSAEIVKLRLTPHLLASGYLNGFGQTERLRELTRINRRISNTIAALQRRNRAVLRLSRMGAKRYIKELAAEAGESA